MTDHARGPFEEIADNLTGRAAGDYSAGAFAPAEELADEQAPYDAQPSGRPVPEDEREVELDDDL